MEPTILKITTSSPEEATALIEILAEMKRAIEKHPVWPSSPVERAAIVSEEAGEVIREANHIREGNYSNPTGLRDELIQTAAVCLRMINVMDAERIAFEQQCEKRMHRISNPANEINVISIPTLSHEETESMLKNKGQGIFALFNHESDRRFSQDAHVLPYNEHHH